MNVVIRIPFQVTAKLPISAGWRSRSKNQMLKRCVEVSGPYCIGIEVTDRIAWAPAFLSDLSNESTIYGSATRPRPSSVVAPAFAPT
jgi:hypothetical protein